MNKQEWMKRVDDLLGMRDVQKNVVATVLVIILTFLVDWRFDAPSKSNAELLLQADRETRDIKSGRG